MFLSCQTGLHFFSLMKRNESKKNQENFILPRTEPTPARAKFSGHRGYPPIGGLWGQPGYAVSNRVKNNQRIQFSDY